MYPIIC